MAARAFILATTYSRHAPKAQNGLSDTPAGIEQGGAFRLVRHGDHVRMSFCRALLGFKTEKLILGGLTPMSSVVYTFKIRKRG